METPRIVDNFFPSFDGPFPSSSSSSDLALFDPDVFDDIGIPRLEADELSELLSSPPLIDPPPSSNGDNNARWVERLYEIDA